MRQKVQNMGNEYEFFIKTPLEKYIGEWVAICDQKIVAHNQDVEKVYAEAIKICPGKRPFFARVPDKAAMIF